MPGEYGLSRFGFAPFGGAPAPFGVVSAVALNQNTIRVIYSALCNLTDPKLTDPSKYVLTPSVAVNHVGVETAASVILYTSQLTSPSYTLTVSDIVSWADRVLNPNPAIVTFGGRIVEGFTAVPVSATKVRLLFSATSMMVNAALTAPTSYSVNYLNGPSFPIIRVEAEGPPNAPVAVALTLGTPMPANTVLLATVVSPDVQTVEGYPITETTSDFRWIPKSFMVDVPFQELNEPFGLLGYKRTLGAPPQAGGQIFFSPAYTNPAPRSAIQVTEVAVCTRAYDVYRVPDEPYAPKVLSTFKVGAPTSVLGAGVSFATFDKLTGAKINLHDYEQDSVAAAADSRCIATVTETLDPARVARLNMINWPIFDGVSLTPFITAANLTPIPPGSTTIRTLEP